MKQILQNFGSGETTIIESPAPKAAPGTLLIQTHHSLISAGTERMLVDFGKASLFVKARQQPEKVKMVWDKVRAEGLWTTFNAVKSKLDQPLPLGYCNAGVVVDVGTGVTGFAVGDRVVSNGAHADVVCVPQNLCAKIPEGVDSEQAAFTVLAAIGLQGIRLVQPSLGDYVAVIGLGLIGLATVQLLRAHGCHVLGIDFDETRLALARQFGAHTCHLNAGEEAVAAGMAFSKGHGVDAVIITASTKSNDPVSQAARMSRKRGRIVLVGVTGLDLNRADFYEKELTFQVSCSYGPGRYDREYEQKGHDYPYGFVRWTEQRNFEAILAMLATGRLDVKPLITHRFAFNDAHAAYELLTSDKTALGILLQYPTVPAEATMAQSMRLATVSSIVDKSRPVCGFIGAGNYASRLLIPAFKAAGAQLHTIVTAGGVSGVIHGKSAGFAEASTDIDAMLRCAAINTIAIATRHNTHAHLVVQALDAGKHVFVEKPLAITRDELAKVEQAYCTAAAKGQALHLMIGFNRRFSPHIRTMKALLSSVKGPKSFVMTINAGAISQDHWTQDIDVGGGRIIGEACHFIDLMRFLAGCAIDSLQGRCLGDALGVASTEDKATFILGFADGSFGAIHYLANGAASFPKERIEVFAAGRVLQLDNFRKLTGYGWPGFRKMHLWRQDKGHSACAVAFLEAIEQGADTPIPAAEIFEVARVSIDAAELLRKS